jgi:hypothetical protein
MKAFFKDWCFTSARSRQKGSCLWNAKGHDELTDAMKRETLKRIISGLNKLLRLRAIVAVSRQSFLAQHHVLAYRHILVSL